MSIRRALPIAFATLLIAVCALLWLTQPAYSGLSQLTTGANLQANPCAQAFGINCDRWDFTAFPVQWNLNSATQSNISGSRSVHDAIAAAFNTWTSAPNTSLQVSEGAQTSVNCEQCSANVASLNVICMTCAVPDFGKDSGTLAVTITTTADTPGQNDGHGHTSKFAGQIIKGDIMFNPAVNFTTDLGAGTSTIQDLQVIATHEIGHFFGLDHSGVVRSVMFPYAGNVSTLTWDDLAAISSVYPKSNPDFAPASISGHILLSGSPVFGAHVYAESTTSAQLSLPNIRKSPVGTLSKPDGSYTIMGLPADSYMVVAEPLDSPVTNTDVSGYPTVFGQTAVQTNFTTRWH